MLSILIPVWNVTPELADMTERNLVLLKERTTLAHEVIVVDNGSPYKRTYPALIVVPWTENKGIAAAWNAGMGLAHGDVLCFLNNDVEVTPGWEVALCEAALDGRRIAFPYTDQGDGIPRRADTAGVAGWCFAIRASLAREIGRFDETFSPAFYEDTDWLYRAWLQGIELSPVPGAVVKHQRRTTASYLPNMDLLFKAHRLKYAWKWRLDPSEAPPFYARTIRDYVSSNEPWLLPTMRL